MNKKDIKRLQEECEAAARGGGSPDSAWYRMYCAVVGGQVGWLASAISEPARFEMRLKTLQDIATAAVNSAVKCGKLVLNARENGARAAKNG